MTIDEVQRRVAQIAKSAGQGKEHDPERAHSLEDDLVWDFIRQFADGKIERPVAVALEVLKAKELDYPRWYA